MDNDFQTDMLIKNVDKIIEDINKDFRDLENYCSLISRVEIQAMRTNTGILILEQLRRDILIAIGNAERKMRGERE